MKELPDRSYSVSDIQGYFEYIIKTYQKGTDNPPIRIYVNKIENEITFKSKQGTFSNLVYDNYQQDSRILYTFASNKSFGPLLDISLTNCFTSKIL